MIHGCVYCIVLQTPRWQLFIALEFIFAVGSWSLWKGVFANKLNKIQLLEPLVPRLTSPSDLQLLQTGKKVKGTYLYDGGALKHHHHHLVM